MKIIKIAVGRMPKVVEIDHTLEAMQEVVKGLIQIYYFDDEGEIVIICNDEGKINGSLPNRAIIDQSGRIRDIIYGDFFLCRAPSDSDDLESIPAPGYPGSCFVHAHPGRQSRPSHPMKCE